MLACLLAALTATVLLATPAAGAGAALAMSSGPAQSLTAASPPLPGTGRNDGGLPGHAHLLWINRTSGVLSLWMLNGAGTVC